MSNWISRTCESALAAFRRVRHWGRNALRFVLARRGSLVLLLLVVAVAIGIGSLITYWDWLRGGSDGFESGSTTVRNVGLVIGGIVAILLAVWRSRVAERQASAAQRQAHTARQTLLNERYQRGAEMLGSEVLSGSPRWNIRSSEPSRGASGAIPHRNHEAVLRVRARPNSEERPGCSADDRRCRTGC